MRALIVTLLFLATWTSRSGAAELPLKLEWNAPNDCASRVAVLRDVERIVGELEQSAPALVSAWARVQRLPDGSWQVTLVTDVDGVRGERALVGRDCAEVSRGTALILALMINPEASLEDAVEQPAESSEPSGPQRTRPESRASERSEPPTSLAQDGSQTAERDTAARGQSATGLVGVGALGGLGLLPKASLAGELRAALVDEPLVVELQIAGWLPRSERAQTLDGAGGEFSLLGANVLVGYRTVLWDGSLGRLGLGATGRRMRATGFGVSDPGSATGYWVGALGEASMAQALTGGIALRLRAGAEVPFSPPRFAIRGVGAVHDVASVGGFVALGLELQF